MLMNDLYDITVIQVPSVECYGVDWTKFNSNKNHVSILLLRGLDDKLKKMGNFFTYVY